MALKTFKPITPSLRQLVIVDREGLWKGKPVKALTRGKHNTGGRNNHGHITSHHMGGGHKRRLRIVDFRRDKLTVPAKGASIDDDPNRSAHLALLHYVDGEKRYILAPIGLQIGDTVVAGPGADIKPGNSLPLKDIPLGTTIHNIELTEGRGGQLVRSAGTAAQLMAKEGDYAQVKLPSGEQRRVRMVCYATIGQVGNIAHENTSLGKAGRKRWLGRRPHVRGMAMNPVDHPHGGGEGRSKGNHPTSPWGTPTKGYKTRRNKRTTKLIVQRRKKK